MNRNIKIEYAANNRYALCRLTGSGSGISLSVQSDLIGEMVGAGYGLLGFAGVGNTLFMYFERGLQPPEESGELKRLGEAMLRDAAELERVVRKITP